MNLLLRTLRPEAAIRYAPRRFAPTLFAAACVGTLSAQTMPAQTTAGHATTARPCVATEAIEPVLIALDEAFAKGDAEAWGKLWAPDNPGAHAMLQHAVERRIAGTAARQRHTTVATEPRRIGERTVVRVRHEYRLQGSPDGHATTFVEDAMLVLRSSAAGNPAAGGAVPTFCIAIAPGRGPGPDDRFRCPPCNYEIGGVPGWLCVQLRADVANALEAASFYLVGTDVACDVSVQVEPTAKPAATAAAELVAAMQRLQPAVTAEAPTVWMPPAHQHDVIPLLSGARVELTLSAQERATCHVVAFGGLQHLLLVRGSPASLRTHRGQIDALLASYRVLDRDCTAALAVARPLEHHGGGTLDGSTYRNVHFGIELAGAANWHPVQRTGGAAFRVSWTKSTGSRLWLTGYQVPPGMTTWTRETADRWLQHLCDRQGLQVRSPGEGWCDDAGPDRQWRLLSCAPREVAGPAAPRQRWLRALLFDDLLVVADGFALDAADEADLQRMLTAVHRH